MGLFDNNMTTNYVDGIVDLEKFHEVLNEKLGNKYEIKFIKKGNQATQMIGAGKNYDQVFIAKNAYHRTFVSINHLTKQLGVENDETHIAFDRETLKWWLSILHGSLGFVGAGIIRLMYGSSVPFDKDIMDALQSKFEIKSRTENYGLSQLWKKDEQAN